MKSRTVVILCLLALLVVPATGYGASPVKEGATITALGYGAASAPPDSVRVSLYIGEEPTYGPGGPKLSFVQPADLEEVQALLLEMAVDEESVEVDIFSGDYGYGGSSKSGEVSFIYSDVAGLRAMLQSVTIPLSLSGSSCQRLVMRLQAPRASAKYRSPMAWLAC